MTTHTPLRHAKNKLTKNLPERRYLPELHGVRGLALLGVVIFHLFGNGRISGGIDVFLAVSGFLFTGMLLREAAAKNGRVDFFKYFGRLIRRIFIPLAVVVVVTLVAGLLISPITQHQQLWAEARASLLYFENFELINSQLAYGAAGPETSPFQHIWSLSVQGQFYLLWPFVAILAVLVARTLNTSAAKVMAILVGTIFVASFVYAIYVGSYNQDEAYLMTTTRVWELAFGGLLALAGGTIRLPKPVRGIFGWVGVALIALCGIFLDGATLFPGPWALWPLTGLTLVLMAAGPTGGHNDPVGSATHFLSNKALAWVGDRSYGLYLWHWPLLIYYMELRERDAIGIKGALVILAITTILAMLVYRHIEQPIQQRYAQLQPNTAQRINKIVLSATVLAVATAGTGATLVLSQPHNQVADVFDDWDWENYPGAMATTHNARPVPDMTDFLPAIEELPDNRPDLYEEGCIQRGGNGPDKDNIITCEDQNKPDDPTATIVISGGSHSIHWYQSWRALADEYNWELRIANKDGCVFMDNDDPDQETCNAWNENYSQWIQKQDVDLVVANGTRIFPDEPEHIEEGAPTRWQQITDSGAQLLLMRGTPRPGDNAADCLADGQPASSCGADTSQIAEVSPLEEYDLPHGTFTIDLIPNVCPAWEGQGTQQCSAVVGNVAVWYDYSHLSDQYVSTMTPILEAELREKASWLF